MKKIKSLIITGIFALTLLAIAPLVASSQQNVSDVIIDNSALICTMEYAPVCGVDGETYSNRCMAGSVQISHEGECDSDEALICTREYKPVCGVDGETYANKCLAGETAIAHEGDCKDVKPATSLTFNGQALERILSPDQIRNFRVVKNENGTLYGVRLQVADQAQERVQTNLSASLNVLASNELIERIPSPDQIGNFRVVKNENGTLYGVRLQVADQSQAKEAIQERARVLEKIPAPQFINQYEDIRRIDNALWGYKKQLADDSPAAMPVMNRVLVTNDIRTCASDAINKKDEDLKSQLSSLNNALTNLINERNLCQNQAISSQERQQNNLDACVKNFQSAHKILLESARERQASIWNNYRSELNNCVPRSENREENYLIIEDGGSAYLERSLGQ